MEVLSDDLEMWAAQASTFFERLGAGWLTCFADEGSQTRLDAWCQIVAAGDEVQFERRLRLDGLDVERVRPILGTVRFVGAEQDLPAWTGTLRGLLRGVGEVEGGHRCLDSENPIPFEEALAPFVAVAGGWLATTPGYGLLAKPAQAALERSLLIRLSVLCARSLLAQFSVFQACRQAARSPFASFLAEPPREEYRAFVQAMLAGEWIVFFRTYPVLARLVATAVDLWVEAGSEFVRRLRADLASIEAVFGAGEAPGEVTALRASLSDPHNGGRTVFELEFASGLKLVYKPRSLGLEAAYANLQTWMNEQGAPLPFKVLQVLDRPAYGWMAFVEHRPCADEAEAVQYYRRAGALLCLLYALETTDCHKENLIACGAHPVLVDLETLMHQRPKVPGREIRGAQFLAFERVAYSVLRVGLLPHWEVRKGQAAYDISGLGGVEEQDGMRLLVWRYTNTDRMALERQTIRIQPGKNVPGLGEDALLPQDYADDVVAGFEDLYRFLLAQRPNLRAPDGPLAPLVGQNVRFVCRPTRFYGTVLMKLTHPRYLQDGVDWSIQLDALSRGVMGEEQTPFWHVLRVEREAMECLDIPYFAARSDSTDLPVNAGEKIIGCFETAGYDLVLARLAALGEDDLAQQVSFIRRALFLRGPAGVHGSGSGVAAEPPEAAPLDPATLVETAAGLARGLADQAIRSDDGGAAWVGPTYIWQAERFQIRTLGYELYGGTAGVGLFLVTLEDVLGGGEFLNLALGAFASLQQKLREGAESLARAVGIGGAAGLGSMVYALVRAGSLLGDAAFLEDARRVAALIGMEQVAADRELDVIGGSAGALLGLLALYRCVGDEGTLEQAVCCGRHLLDRRAVGKGGFRAWPTREGKLLTGFSHGAAGIAYALIRLYAATGERAFLDAAEEGMAYEDAVFVPGAGNWPDYREDRPGFMTSWCHGAPGIGLGRLGGLAVSNGARVLKEIEMALETTRAFGLKGADHLCCGNLGRLDLLVTAAQELNRPVLLEAARAQAARLVARANQRGSFFYDHGIYNPGFFTGSAGIGYQLLRLIYPDRVPSVLLWA